MTLESYDDLIGRYCRTASSNHGYRGAELDALVCAVNDTIDDMDREKPGLRLGIGRRLADHTLEGSPEHQAIQWAIMSVIDGKRVHRPRNWEEFFGHGDLVHDDSDTNPSQIAEDFERLELSRAAVKSAIEALPEREQTILRMLYWEGKNQATISRILGIPVSTVSDVRRKACASLARPLRHLRELYTPGR